MQKKSPRPLQDWSITQLEGFIRKQSLNTANVIFVDHALDRMKDRNVLKATVIQVLRKGRMVIPPELDSQTGDLKCRMELFCVGFTHMVVVALSDDNPNLMVITVIKKSLMR